MSLETEQERKKLTEIYNDHKHAFFNVALKITKNHQIAEDAIHNTFEQLIKKNKDEMFSLSHDDFRRRYIIIVKNKAIDLMRRENIYSDAPIEDFGESLQSEEVPVDIQIINKEKYSVLKECIEALDDESKIVLQMKYVLNMSYKEISEAIKLTPAHINVKITRAKAKVRKMMEER